MRCGKGEERGLKDSVAIFYPACLLLGCRTHDQRGRDAWFLRDVRRVLLCRLWVAVAANLGPQSLTVGQTVVQAPPPDWEPRRPTRTVTQERP